MGHTGAYIINSFFTGSSPPMLGIPLSAPGGDLSKWFIPTYVGHTAAPGLRWTARPVHPHIRGAYARRQRSAWGLPVHPHIRRAYIPPPGAHCLSNGSSPHTWGIRNGERVAHYLNRFIPTYVGHTKNSIAWGVPETVHPHIRGAYVNFGKKSASVSGSSPHTWGIRTSALCRQPFCRFIPTYVGHTKRLVCNVDEQRFIPTYVGHTSLADFIIRASSVHPHIRGAYMTLGSKFVEYFGSSPHTWGILPQGHLLFQPGRFIPTYVGHTRTVALSEPLLPVHPHIRGAYLLYSSSVMDSSGSSPHTWGIPHHCKRDKK